MYRKSVIPTYIPGHQHAIDEHVFLRGYTSVHPVRARARVFVCVRVCVCACACVLLCARATYVCLRVCARNCFWQAESYLNIIQTLQ